MLISLEVAVKLAKTRRVPFAMIGKGTALPDIETRVGQVWPAAARTAVPLPR